MVYVNIEFDDEHRYEDTVREVAKLLEEGYTSGICPTFEVVMTDEERYEYNNQEAEVAC